jgi:hypothetical protein
MKQKMSRILAPAFAGALAIVLFASPALAENKKQLALVTNADADF